MESRAQQWERCGLLKTIARATLSPKLKALHTVQSDIGTICIKIFYDLTNCDVSRRVAALFQYTGCCIVRLCQIALYVGRICQLARGPFID